jgi:type I restriction enzyme M protein
MADARNDKDKITKASVQKRLYEIMDDKDADDERNVLKEYMKLAEEETEENKKTKESQAILEKKVLAKYKTLSIEEIKTLVVEDKWLARLEQDVQTEMQRISQRLTGRIKELAERYGETLPSLEEDVEKMEKTVKGHLGKMGFAWK